MAIETHAREPHRERSYRDYHRLVPREGVRSDARLKEIVGALQEECGDTLLAVMLFGSRLVGSSPARHSAYDLVLVVDRYAPFFRRLGDTGRLHRAPALFTALSHVLPPTNISYRVRADFPFLAKCMVLSWRHLETTLSEPLRDHFCVGRLIHEVALLHARSPAVESRLIEVLANARGTALSWVAPFVDAPFTTREFTRTMLRVSFRGEIRPESGGRPREVVASQARYLDSVFGSVLEEAARRGLLVRTQGGFRYTEPPSPLERLRWRLYFRWSSVRATARWLKHILTFESWLDYIRRKVERRMGLRIELTSRERRYPLIFLWPKVVKVLRARNRAGPGHDRNREPDGS